MNTYYIILSFTLPCLLTTLGSALVFFFNRQSKTLNTLTLGLASGVMLSASIFSLLLPALENATATMGNLAFLPIVLGFVLGGLFLVFLDKISAIFFEKSVKNSKKKAFKLFTAITIHNIPEGLSVGFAIGTALSGGSSILLAFIFALGIAIQNFPEGLATALPMQNCFQNKPKAFFLGTLSGIVEPIFAIIGFFLAAYIGALLPWLLSFSAGAMIYVIIEEMLPEIHPDDKPYGSWAFVLGFVIMMILDICL